LQYAIAITVPKMTVLNTGRFAGLLRGQCPETPHSLLWQARVPNGHHTLGVSVAKAAIGKAKHGNLGSLVGVERERFRAQVIKMERATTATLALEVPTIAGELPQIRRV
jgi:hypothetical protein